jgi:hypothetical protein
MHSEFVADTHTPPERQSQLGSSWRDDGAGLITGVDHGLLEAPHDRADEVRIGHLGQLPIWAVLSRAGRPREWLRATARRRRSERQLDSKNQCWIGVVHGSILVAQIESRRRDSIRFQRPMGVGTESIARSDSNAGRMAAWPLNWLTRSLMAATRSPWPV